MKRTSDRIVALRGGVWSVLMHDTTLTGVQRLKRRRPIFGRTIAKAFFFAMMRGW